MKKRGEANEVSNDFGEFDGGIEFCVGTRQPTRNGNRKDRERDAGYQVLRAVGERTADFRRGRPGDERFHGADLARGRQ
jgi:hypothetical protein